MHGGTLLPESLTALGRDDPWEPRVQLRAAPLRAKDPQTAQWASDPAAKEYRDALKKYSPKSDPEDAFNMYGWTAATTMAKALEQMK